MNFYSAKCRVVVSVVTMGTIAQLLAAGDNIVRGLGIWCQVLAAL
jgi:hypothetical protein